MMSFAAFPTVQTTNFSSISGLLFQLLCQLHDSLILGPLLLGGTGQPWPWCRPPRSRARKIQPSFSRQKRPQLLFFPDSKYHQISQGEIIISVAQNMLHLKISQKNRSQVPFLPPPKQRPRLLPGARGGAFGHLVQRFRAPAQVPACDISRQRTRMHITWRKRRKGLPESNVDVECRLCSVKCKVWSVKCECKV